MSELLIKISADGAQAKKELESVSRSIGRFGAQVRGIASMASQSVTGLRQMAQGFQNLGFVLTAFVTLPVVRFMRDATESVLDFEDALVEVSKTTGLPQSGINKLSESIRELSLRTPTAQSDLAMLAAEAGRLGLAVNKSSDQAVADILKFVDVVDKMQIATVLTGEEAARAFGKLIAVLGDIDINNIENLGSSINELAQSSTVAADDIVQAALRIAPAAAALGLAAPDVLALGTAIVQGSESAARGATRLRNALERLGLNYEAAAILVGESSEFMRQKIEENAIEGFMMIIDAASQSEDKIGTLQSVFGAFGSTGTNAILRLGEGIEGLNDLLAISRNAFEEGTSLQNEFNRAMTSTRNTLGVVANNLSEIGKKFAMDILPTIRSILVTIVPAIQEFGEWVGKLSVETKLIAVALAAFLAIGIPVLALLGSFGFAITMVLNGIVNFIGGLSSLLITTLTFGGATKLATAGVIALASALGGIIVIAIAKSAGAFDMILEKIAEIASQMAGWADKLIGTFAGDLVRAASKYLIDALNYIGNMIADFLKPGSPPKKGPLSTINQWGKRLIDTYLQGFKKADFSVLEDISGTIAHLLQNMVDTGQMREVDLAPALDEARTLVAELLSRFNKTGVIAEDVLQRIADMFGEAGDEIEKLIRLQLEYNKAVEDLEKIRAKEKDIGEVYKSEIRAIQARQDLTGAEKLNMIRQARMRKNLALENVDTEKSATQKIVDGVKEQLDWFKEYIDALKDTDDIWKDHLDAIKNVIKSLRKVGKAIEDVIDRLLKQLEANLALQKIYESKGLDTTSLLREELNIRKNIAKELLGKNELSEDEQALLDANIDRIAVLERILGDTSTKWDDVAQIGESDWGIDDLSDSLGTLKGQAEAFVDVLERGRLQWDLFKAGISGVAVEDLFGELGVMPSTPFQDAFDPSNLEFYSIGKQIRDMIDKVVEKFEYARDRVQSVIKDIKKAFSSVTTNFAKAITGDEDVEVTGDDIAGIIKKILPKIFLLVAGFKLLKGTAGFLFSVLTGAAIGGAGGKLAKGIGLIAIAIGGLMDGFDFLKDKLGDVARESAKTGDKFIQRWGKIGHSIVDKLKSAGQVVAMWMGRFSKNVVKMFNIGIIQSLRDAGSAVKKMLLSPFQKAGGGIVAFFRGLGPKIVSGIRSLPALLSGAARGAAGALVSGFTSAISGIWGMIGSIGAAIATIGQFFFTITGIGAAILAAAGIIVAAVMYIKDNWDDFKDRFTNAFEDIKRGIKGFVDSLKKALGIGGDAAIDFKEILGGILLRAEPIARFIGGLLADAFRVLGAVVGSVLPAIGTIVGSIFRGIAQAAIGIIDTLGGIIEFFAGLIDFFKGEGTGRMEAALKQIAMGILEIFSGLLVPVVGFFKGIAEFIRNIVAKIVSGLRDKFGDNAILNGIINFVNGAVAWFEWLYGVLTGKNTDEVFESIKDTFGSIVDWFSTTFSGIYNTVKDIFGGIADFITNDVGPAIESVIDFFRGIGDAISGGAKDMAAPYEAIGSAIKGVIDWFKELYSKVKGTIDFIRSAFEFGGAEGGLMALWKVLRKVFGPLADVIKPVIKLIYKFVKIIEPIVAAFKEGFAEGGLLGGFAAIEDVLPSLLEKILSFFGSLLTLVPEMLVKLGKYLWDYGIPAFIGWITAVPAFLAEKIPPLLAAFGAFISDIVSSIYTWLGEKGIPAFANFILSIISTVREKGPELWSSFEDLLGKLIGNLWLWITNDAIPWVIGLIKSIVDFVTSEGPGIIETFSNIMVILSQALWNWITNDLLPWIIGLVTTITNYIKERGPSFAASMMANMAALIGKLWAWVRTDFAAWLGGWIEKGIILLKGLGTDWLTEIGRGLDKIKDKFDAIFGMIKAIILAHIKNAVNGLIELFEKAVNSVIGAVNDLIRAFNKIAKALGLKGLKELGKIQIKRLETGGIATRATIAMVGEAGPEAIVPLSKLGSMMDDIGGGLQSVEININNPVVRDDDDLRTIVETVKYEIGLGLQNRSIGYGRGLG